MNSVLISSENITTEETIFANPVEEVLIEEPNDIPQIEDINDTIEDFYMDVEDLENKSILENIEKIISATQVLIDSPNYSSDYGYDEIESDKA